MTFADIHLDWPEIILATGALALLLVGAFRRKGGAVFDLLAMLVLAAAAIAADSTETSAVGEEGEGT